MKSKIWGQFMIESFTVLKNTYILKKIFKNRWVKNFFNISFSLFIANPTPTTDLITAKRFLSCMLTPFMNIQRTNL